MARHMKRRKGARSSSTAGGEFEEVFDNPQGFVTLKTPTNRSWEAASAFVSVLSSGPKSF